MTVQGEWFLDTTFGLDYFGVIWVKATPSAVLAAHVKETILKSADPGDLITEFEMDYDGLTRNLTVTAVLTSSDGTTITVGV